MDFLHLPKDDVHGPEFPILLHYNLITDPRTVLFKNALDEEVKEGMRILDLGSGSGIFSMLSSLRGGNVLSVEKDSQLVSFSKEIVKKNNLQDRITIICDDAETFIPDGKFDMIICEMQDTACIRERQIQVMNRSLDFLNPHGKIISQGIRNFVSLSEVNYNFFGLDIPLPFFDTKEVPSPHNFITDKILMNEISFMKKNKLEIDCSLEMTAIKEGIVNSFTMETDTIISDNYTSHGTDWFNAPYVIPFGKEIKMNKGDILTLNLSYTMGEGLKSFSCDYKM